MTLLNLFVGATCFTLAQFPNLNWVLLLLFSVAGFLAVGGCGVLNCYLDRDVDRLMNRTSRRVIPSGLVAPWRALVFGIVLISSGLLVIVAEFGFFTSFLTVLGMAFYIVVYTMFLKRRTHWNVIIGGVAGTFAALAGWTATGNPLSLTPLLVGILDFLWTPGHLWGLAIKAKEEYRGAAVPMLPVKVGPKKAADVVLEYNVLVFGVSLLFPLLGLAGWVYLVPVAFAGLVMINESRKLARNALERQAFRVFKVSAPYLAIVMCALIVDRIVLV